MLIPNHVVGTGNAPQIKSPQSVAHKKLVYLIGAIVAASASRKASIIK